MSAKGTSSEAKAALDRLCTDYYRPVLNFIRRNLASETRGSAEDIAHDFFVRILEGKEFQHLERGPGRFRSYLLGAVRFFLLRLREKESVQKRGGIAAKISLNSDPGLLAELSCSFNPDWNFDRDWAESIFERTIRELREEARKDGREKQFELLRENMLGPISDNLKEETISELGINREHFKVLLSRLRKKFRESIRKQIAQTVENESEIAEELEYLILAIHRSM